MALSKSNIDVETGSDAEKVKLCTACSDEGDHRPAVKYCIDCNQPICKTCVDSHRRIKLLKNHKLVDHENEDAVKLAQLVSSYLACPNHPEKNIEFMCKDHDVMCCITCATASHRSCSEVREITNQSAGAIASSETQHIITQLDAAKQQMEKIVKQHETHNAHVSKQTETEIPKQVQEIKEKVITALNEFEKLALSQSATLGRKEIENGVAEINKWNSKIESVEEASKIVKTMQETGSDVHVYVAVKKTMKTLLQIENAITTQGTKIRLRSVVFEGDDNLRNIASMAPSDLVHVSGQVKRYVMPRYKPAVP